MWRGEDLKKLSRRLAAEETATEVVVEVTQIAQACVRTRGPCLG